MTSLPPMQLTSSDQRRVQNLQQVVGFAQQQLRQLVSRYPGAFPMYTQGGRWSVEGERWTNWCEGFLGGQGWLLSQYAGQPVERAWFRAQAEHYSRLVEERKHDRNVHDLGFVFLPTWKRWYDLTGDLSKREVVIQAGRTLAMRFMTKGQYLRSFLAPDSLLSIL